MTRHLVFRPGTPEDGTWVTSGTGIEDGYCVFGVWSTGLLDRRRKPNESQTTTLDEVEVWDRECTGGFPGEEHDGQSDLKTRNQ